MDRIDKINYYLDIADSVLKRGTCLRRNYGCVIVNNDEIVSTGYTGSPRGRKNCIELNYCKREEADVPRGERYELSRSVHAEANAMISASRKEMIGSTLYLVGRDYKTKELVENANCCTMCKRMVINSGIFKVVARDTQDEYREIEVQKWIEDDDSL